MLQYQLGHARYEHSHHCSSALRWFQRPADAQTALPTQRYGGRYGRRGALSERHLFLMAKRIAAKGAIHQYLWIDASGFLCLCSGQLNTHTRSCNIKYVPTQHLKNVHTFETITVIPYIVFHVKRFDKYHPWILMRIGDILSSNNGIDKQQGRY